MIWKTMNLSNDAKSHYKPKFQHFNSCCPSNYQHEDVAKLWKWMVHIWYAKKTFDIIKPCPL
jgi:hypothetical protein